MEIGKQIKNLRMQKSVTQEQLADYLGISFQAVSKWETCASTPDITLLPKIAVYFGVSIDELFQLPKEAEMERIENMYINERQISPQNFQHAINVLEGILKEEPNQKRALICMAYLYNHRAHSDHELASEYAKKVLEIAPETKSAIVAFLEAENGLCGDMWYDNHFKVIRYLKEFVEKNPKNYRGLYVLIENLLADDRFEEALPYIKQIGKVKKNHQYELYMGDVAMGRGKAAEAFEHWNKMVEDYPQVWQAWCSKGERYQRQGRYEEALIYYEKCFEIQEKPRIYDGLCSMAQVHELLGNYDAAIEDVRRIIHCLKEEHHVIDGECIDSREREIKRLEKLKAFKRKCAEKL